MKRFSFNIMVLDLNCPLHPAGRLTARVKDVISQIKYYRQAQTDWIRINHGELLAGLPGDHFARYFFHQSPHSSRVWILAAEPWNNCLLPTKGFYTPYELWKHSSERRRAMKKLVRRYAAEEATDTNIDSNFVYEQGLSEATKALFARQEIIVHRLPYTTEEEDHFTQVYSDFDLEQGVNTNLWVAFKIFASPGYERELIVVMNNAAANDGRLPYIFDRADRHPIDPRAVIESLHFRLIE